MKNKYQTKRNRKKLVQKYRTDLYKKLFYERDKKASEEKDETKYREILDTSIILPI